MSNNLSFTPFVYRPKFAFLVQQGLDHFIDDVISLFSNSFEIRKCVITHYPQIDAALEWADYVWCEWCNEVAAYASLHRPSHVKLMFCRLHAYEAYTDIPNKVSWEHFDRIIFVGNHVRSYCIHTYHVPPEKTIHIPNGIPMNRYQYRVHTAGTKIAYLGYLHGHKGIDLMLQVFYAAYQQNPNYTLHIAGTFQDDYFKRYLEHMIPTLGIQNSVFFNGWQTDVNGWLEDKDYLLCPSISESQNLSTMQAMAKGIKPIIHNFPGSSEIYQKKWIWNTVDEARDMILSSEYDSMEYHTYIEKNFSIEIEQQRLLDLLQLSMQK